MRLPILLMETVPVRWVHWVQWELWYRCPDAAASQEFVEVLADLDYGRPGPDIRATALPVNIMARRSSDRYQYPSDPIRRLDSRKHRRRSNVPVSRRPARRHRPRSPSRIRHRCYRRPWRNHGRLASIRSNSRAQDRRSFAKDSVLCCSWTRQSSIPRVVLTNSLFLSNAN